MRRPFQGCIADRRMGRFAARLAARLMPLFADTSKLAEAVGACIQFWILWPWDRDACAICLLCKAAGTESLQLVD